MGKVDSSQHSGYRHWNSNIWPDSLFSATMIPNSVSSRHVILQAFQLPLVAWCALVNYCRMALELVSTSTRVWIIHRRRAKWLSIEHIGTFLSQAWTMDMPCCRPGMALLMPCMIQQQGISIVQALCMAWISKNQINKWGIKQVYLI